MQPVSPQAYDAGHILQFAIAIRRAGEAIQRMVGDIEFHHAFAERMELVALRMHDHAVLGRCGAGCRRATTTFDFDEAHTARAERLEHIGGAEFRNLCSHFHRRGHHGCALRHRDGYAVNGKR